MEYYCWVIYFFLQKRISFLYICNATTSGIKNVSFALIKLAPLIFFFFFLWFCKFYFSSKSLLALRQRTLGSFYKLSSVSLMLIICRNKMFGMSDLMILYSTVWESLKWVIYLFIFMGMYVLEEWFFGECVNNEEMF